RFMLMCLPALLLLVAVAISRSFQCTRMLHKVIGSTLLVALIAFSLSEDVRQYKTLPMTNGALVMSQYVLAEQQPDDAAIFFTAAAHLWFNYYVNSMSANGHAPTIVIPDFKGYPTGAQPIPTVDEVRSAIQGKERVWLILNNGWISFTPARREAVPI